jgi:hypothetical protein
VNKKLTFIILSILFVTLAFFLIFEYVHPIKKEIKGQFSLETKDKYKVGKSANIDLNLDSKTYNINAAEVYLDYDPQFLEIQSIDKIKSIFKLWIEDEPKFLNKEGVISFAGGIPTPGFTGKGIIGTIRVKFKKTGKTSIQFDKRSRMLLNDNNGTSLPLSLEPINLDVKE